MAAYVGTSSEQNLRKTLLKFRHNDCNVNAPTTKKRKKFQLHITGWKKASEIKYKSDCFCVMFVIHSFQWSRFHFDKLRNEKERDIWNNVRQCSWASHWTVYSTLPLRLCLPPVPLAHSPMLPRLPMQRADSVMTLPSPIAFPKGEKREKVEEKMLSWLCKAERTPNEYIIMLIKVSVCFGYGQLVHFK